MSNSPASQAETNWPPRPPKGVGAVSDIAGLRRRLKAVWNDDYEVDYGKLSGRVEYGSRLTITWDGRYPGWERDFDDAPTYEDDGYLMGLPGLADDDAALGGVVHIPNPNNEGGKGEADPVWITLYDLLLFPDVLRVEGK